MSTLSVSSYSIRELLGPVSFEFTAPDGSTQTFGWDHPKELDLAAFPAGARERFGVDAVETVGFQFTGLDDPEIDRFAARLAESGIRLLNVAVDAGDLANPDDAARAADVELLGRWIERFGALGSAFVRVNPGSPFAAHAGGDPAPHLVAALRELGAVAAANGTRLLVENHGGPSSDPAWITRLLDEVGDSLGLLLDLGNFDVVTQPLMAVMFAPPGTAPAPEDVFAAVDIEPVYADIAALAPRAELVHVKTHFVTDDGVVGAIDLPRALGILAEAGYDGPLTVEYEGEGGDPWAKTGRVLEVVREALAAGTPASATAEATR